MSVRSLRPACLGLLLLALSLLAANAALAKLPVMVSIAPQEYFVQKVGGDLVSISVMVPPGASPHSFEPRPSQMATLAKAKVYFAIGVEFEKAWLGRFRAANPKMLVVHTEAKVPRVAMEGREEHGRHHEHGEEKPGHGHKHQGLDPHIWLSPRLVAIQAQAIRDGLVRADPAHRAAYDQNLAAFQKELKSLDQKLALAFQGLKGKRSILVFHPAWGYLCRAYGLKQVAVEKEGKEPTAKGLAHLIHQAKEEGAKVIFVQPQFSSAPARTVAKAIGGRVVALNPLAPDWEANLMNIVRELKKAAY